MRQVDGQEQLIIFLSFMMHQTVTMIKCKQALDDILRLLHAGARLNLDRS